MTVSTSWLVNINVTISTNILQTNFNNIALIGRMPTQSSPYQCPPTSWGTNPFQYYTNSSSFQTDFNPLVTAAIAASDIPQATRFQWLIDAVSSAFDQIPTPQNLLVMAMAPANALTNYTTELAALSLVNDSWYGFSIVDNIPPLGEPLTQNLSKVLVTVTITSSFNLPVGIVGVSGASSPYLTYVTYDLYIPGTYTLEFYSIDTEFVVPINGITSISYNGSDYALFATNTASSFLSAVNFSYLSMPIATTGPGTIPAGTVAMGTYSTSPYISQIDNVISGAGVTNIIFVSLDIVTVIPVNAMDDIVYNDTLFDFVVYPTTSTESSVVIATTAPGILTPNIGVIAALNNFRSSNVGDPKKCFLDTNDPTVAGTIQAAGGSQDLLICYHSTNFPDLTSPQIITTSLSAACLSAYFTNLFLPGVGLKSLGSLMLQGPTTNIDPTITTANIGNVKNPGSISNLIGWNNNVFAGIGAPPGIGLMQYGLMSSSTQSALLYLDQVVGADHIQINAQNDLTTFIVAQQPLGGVEYSDAGIQQLVQVFKNSIQKAVIQNIVQSPLNAAFVYQTYAQVFSTNAGNIANRLYNGLTFNGNFANRIQQLSISVNLSL